CFLLPPHPNPTLFPYTTLFRSDQVAGAHGGHRITFSFRGRDRENADGKVQLIFVPRVLRVGEEPRTEYVLRRAAAQEQDFRVNVDRKSTRLNSSHLGISYAVFC